MSNATKDFSDYERVKLFKQGLSQKILECPSSKNLHRIIVELPARIKRQIGGLEIATNVQTVMQVINVCLEFPDGLEKLVREIAFFDEGTIALQELLNFLKEYDYNFETNNSSIANPPIRSSVNSYTFVNNESNKKRNAKILFICCSNEDKEKQEVRNIVERFKEVDVQVEMPDYNAIFNSTNKEYFIRANHFVFVITKSFLELVS